MNSIGTRSELETIEHGVELAQRLSPGAVVLLIGNLGAGKTTMAKGIAKGLGAATYDEVSSPTFTLIHEYGDPPKLYHVDLYRLDDAKQVASLGLEEIFESSAVVLIEWGERFLDLMPAERLEVRIERLPDETREITVSTP
ncbi:MAG: tRNA (adenosine(37)-N6)-threonylcarbamoyltransferase complex ATPase subunit type 1 TsaE [bacterium]|nr:tRNA (adenosine(37)-N6)-threonylcarbamoyltransferase complex ATPase subunit type 1 TsaE [bacterium]